MNWLYSKGDLAYFCHYKKYSYCIIQYYIFNTLLAHLLDLKKINLYYKSTRARGYESFMLQKCSHNSVWFLKDFLSHLKEQSPKLASFSPHSPSTCIHTLNVPSRGQWTKAVTHSKYSSGFPGFIAASSCQPPGALRGGVGVGTANWAEDESSESANGKPPCNTDTNEPCPASRGRGNRELEVSLLSQNKNKWKTLMLSGGKNYINVNSK